MADIPTNRMPGRMDQIPASVTDPTAEVSNLSLKSQLLRPRTIISFLLSFGLIAFIFARQNIPFAEVWANIRQTNLALLALSFLVYYTSFYVRTLRWKQVLNNVGYTEKNGAHLPSTPKLTRIILLSWFANSILPAKLGDGYRGYLLKRASGNVSFFKAMGTILAERIADVGMLFALLLISGLIAFRDQLPPNFGVLVAFGAALAVLALSALFFLRYLGPWIQRLLPQRMRPSYVRVEEGVLLAFQQRIGLIMGLTASIWLLDGLRFWLVAASLGRPLGLSLVVFLALAASLLTTVPFTPAGLGIVEGAILTVLKLVMDDASMAGSIALLDRTVTYWSLLLVGTLVYLFSRNK